MLNSFKPAIHSMHYKGSMINAFLDGDQQTWLQLDSVINALNINRFSNTAENLVPAAWKKTFPDNHAVFINQPGFFKLVSNYDPIDGVAFVEWFFLVMKPRMASTISQTRKPATFDT